MKLKIIILAAFFIACTGSQRKKEAIVEQQMALAKEINVERAIIKDVLWDLKNKKDMSVDEIYNLKEKSDLADLRKDSLQVIYDSLELELKKY